jgi:hypothetical protein
MPYTDLRLRHGRYGRRPAVVIVRWAPWLTVADRWLAAPRRPEQARPSCDQRRYCNRLLAVSFRHSCWSRASESSTSAARGRLTTIARSSPKPAALLQSPCCRSLLPVGKWSCGGAGDERSPLGAATAQAGRRSAEGTANPHSDRALSLAPRGARRANRRKKEQG